MSSEQSWTAAQHRDFVAAIYETGLHSSSPVVILQNMLPTHETITTDRVKSHLQKYRRNRSKAKEKFMAAYDKWMAKAISLTTDLNRPLGGNVEELHARNPAALSELREHMNPANHSLGETAAYLAFLVMLQEKRRRDTEQASRASLPSGDESTKLSETITAANDPVLLSHLAYESVSYPQLSREEMDSPLGQGLEYTRKLMSTISSHLHSHRIKHLQLNPHRLRSGQKVLTPSERYEDHRAWGKPPARRGKSFQRDLSSGWHTSALGSGGVCRDNNKDTTDSTMFGDGISPRTSSLLEAVAQASAAMQSTWLPVEGGTRYQIHLNNHPQLHSERRDMTRWDENWSGYVDNMSPSSSLRFIGEDHMMRGQVDNEPEPRQRGNSMESTHLNDGLVGDRHTPEYGMQVFYQHHASEIDWSHGIRPHGRWEHEKATHGSLPTTEALPWQPHNLQTTVPNHDEHGRQTNEVMYRRGDPLKGGDAHAPYVPDSSYPWGGAPPYI